MSEFHGPVGPKYNKDNYNRLCIGQPKSAKKKFQYDIGRQIGQGSYCDVVHCVWSVPRGFPGIQPGKLEVVLRVTRKPEKKGVSVRPNPPDEIEIMKGIRHENLAMFYDSFESRKCWYLSYQYARGGDLQQRLDRKQKFEEKHTAFVTRSVLRGLEYLHRMNVLHRDIKPENIVYRTTEETSDVLIVDFNLAVKVTESTRKFATAGTNKYVAPEIVRENGHRVDAFKGTKADMWSTGVMVYQFLTGSLPYDGETEDKLVKLFSEDGDEKEKTALKISYEGPLWENISPAAKDFVQRLLRKRRFYRASAEAALKHEFIRSVTVLPKPKPSPHSKPPPRPEPSPAPKPERSTPIGGKDKNRAETRKSRGILTEGKLLNRLKARKKDTYDLARSDSLHEKPMHIGGSAPRIELHIPQIQLTPDNQLERLDTPVGPVARSEGHSKDKIENTSPEMRDRISQSNRGLSTHDTRRVGSPSTRGNEKIISSNGLKRTTTADRSRIHQKRNPSSRPIAPVSQTGRQEQAPILTTSQRIEKRKPAKLQKRRPTERLADKK